jgi:hypothetical protein
LRVTPAGTRYLKLEADCGDESKDLLLEIVIVGDGVAELGQQLCIDDRIQASGSLRARLGDARRGAKLGVEVIADRVTLVERITLAERSGASRRVCELRQDSESVERSASTKLRPANEPRSGGVGRETSEK